MKIKAVPFKYAQKGSHLYLNERQIKLANAAKPGKVFESIVKDRPVRSIQGMKPIWW